MFLTCIRVFKRICLSVTIHAYAVLVFQPIYLFVKNILLHIDCFLESYCTPNKMLFLYNINISEMVISVFNPQCTNFQVFASQTM